MGVGLEFGVGKPPLATTLFSILVVWIFGTSGSVESMMMSTCSSDATGWGRDGGFSVSGVSATLKLILVLLLTNL